MINQLYYKAPSHPYLGTSPIASLLLEKENQILNHVKAISTLACRIKVFDHDITEQRTSEWWPAKYGQLLQDVRQVKYEDASTEQETEALSTHMTKTGIQPSCLQMV